MGLLVLTLQGHCGDRVGIVVGLEELTTKHILQRLADNPHFFSYQKTNQSSLPNGDVRKGSLRIVELLLQFKNFYNFKTLKTAV